MISRRRGREFAMQVLYAAEVGEETLESASKTLSQEEPAVPLDAQEYGMKLSRTVREHTDAIDQRITETAASWEVGRLAVVDRIILRMAIAELLYIPDVPSKVCINEAVEIAKKFSTENSSRFVNGILDTIAHQLDKHLPNSNKDA